MSTAMMLQSKARSAAGSVRQAASRATLCASASTPSIRPTSSSPVHAAVSSVSCNAPVSSRRALSPCCSSPPASSSSAAVAPSAETGKLISSTEVPPFIQRDDMIDQLYHWAIIEAGDAGFRNFGMPMTVEPVYRNEILWGFNCGMYKDGEKLTDIGVCFDGDISLQHEWLGRGEDGFPVKEGRATEIDGKNIQIWKLDMKPVTEELRSTIRAYCTGLVSALNRYYAFGSVFVDDERG